ncbi:hypothetical protein BDW69DRAFT_55814 [Aspergillus filifer]
MILTIDQMFPRWDGIGPVRVWVLKLLLLLPVSFASLRFLLSFRQHWDAPGTSFPSLGLFSTCLKFPNCFLSFYLYFLYCRRVPIWSCTFPLQLITSCCETLCWCIAYCADCLCYVGSDCQLTCGIVGARSI